MMLYIYQQIWTLKSINLDTDHSKMTAFIRYKTRYVMNGRDLFPFAQGTEISLRYVLGLPTLLSMEKTLDLVSSGLSCIELDRPFCFDLNSASKGLPDGTTLNYYAPFILPRFSTNIKSETSILHYTSADGASYPMSGHFF